MVCGDCAPKNLNDAASSSKVTTAGDLIINFENPPEPPLVVYEDRGNFGSLSPDLQFLESQDSFGSRDTIGSNHNRLITQQPPDSKLPNRNEQQKSFCFQLTLIWILLIGYIGHIGILVWLIIRMMKILPHTFGWKALLLPFGSYYNGILNTATPPIFPIIQLLISILIVITILTLVIFSTECLFNTVQVMVCLQFIFSIPIIPITFALWMYKQSELRRTMTTAMSVMSKTMSFHPWDWNITQESGHCCGLDQSSDWEGISGTPISCFASVNDLWPQGCYQIEYWILLSNGIILFFSFISGVFLAGTQLCILIHRHELRFRAGILRTSTFQSFIFKQGSSFAALSTFPNRTLLHLQGVVLETTGALGYQIVVEENQAKIQILNFKISLDNVKIEHERTRIVISVERNGISRGVCAVSTIDQNQLEDLQIEDTKIGFVSIILPTSLI